MDRVLRRLLLVGAQISPVGDRAPRPSGCTSTRSSPLPVPLTYVAPQVAHAARRGGNRLWLSVMPQSHTQPAIRDGFPTASARSGTSLITTAPAPISAYCPIVTPHRTVLFAPRLAPRLTSVCR